MTRVASGSPRMSRDMVLGNRLELKKMLQAFRLELNALEQLLDQTDQADQGEALLAAAEHAKKYP
ncbi:MAG: prephenate dehydrogenase dimerization domain-containing protein [Deinococcales bacterium]